MFIHGFTDAGFILKKLQFEKPVKLSWIGNNGIKNFVKRCLYCTKHTSDTLH